MADFPQISRMGERSFLVQFEPEITPELLEKLLFYKNKIENSEFKEKLEVINTYNSLLITYIDTIENIYDEFLALKELFNTAKIEKNIHSKIFHIPVCYSKKFGLDLELISSEKNLRIDEIIRLHTTPIYRVYFLGFLPGFLYLGGLDEKLHFPRKNSPRKSIEKGAVGIGGNQTGIYPKSSPGGWQIIGETPIELFDKNLENPSPFSAGDRLKFYSVSLEEFETIQTEVKAGNFELKQEVYEG